jgi:hypothetical protein
MANRIHQQIPIKRFSQARRRALRREMLAGRKLIMSRNEDDGSGGTGALQVFPKIEAAHSAQVHIENQTVDSRNIRGGQELFRRRICLNGEALRSKQARQTLAHGDVVVDHTQYHLFHNCVVFTDVIQTDCEKAADLPI